MEQKNYLKITEGLYILREIFALYLCRELETAFGARWWNIAVINKLYELKQQKLPTTGTRDELAKSLDISLCARLFDLHWYEVFKKKLENRIFYLTRELKEYVRNTNAHITQDFSDNDTWRALDIMARLCEAFGDINRGKEIRALYGNGNTMGPPSNGDEQNKGIITEDSRDVHGKGTIWIRSADGKARFVLGEVSGRNPVICFGNNPSTATPYKDDPTIQSVRRIANNSKNNYDGYVMLNVYPQITTKCDQLHIDYLSEFKSENERQIAKIIKNMSENNNGIITLWAGWGTLIKKRAYLPKLLSAIKQLSEVKKCKWVTLDLSKYNPARHPLYVNSDTVLEPFNK